MYKHMKYNCKDNPNGDFDKFKSIIKAKDKVLKEKEETIEKLQNTFEMIDQMNDLDLDKFQPLNNPLELTNVSRADEEKNRNKKEEFLEKSPKSDEDYFVVPKIVE